MAAKPRLGARGDDPPFGVFENENDLLAMVEAEVADLMGEFHHPTARDYRQMADDLQRAQGPRPGPDAPFWALVIQALRGRSFTAPN